ncbi:MAG: hypothetical protein COA41_04685 [Sphingopyxis sp.]|nr:MAG: hypothetical protein COA41_04685 [Sphingopyxis sp.]
MASDENKLQKDALALFERSLDQRSDNRAAWIRAQAGEDKKLLRQTLRFLDRDLSAISVLNTGGALFDTLDDTQMPDRIGAYRITAIIGRGGMGTVYRGERASGDFDHDVAIKVIRPGVFSDKLIERFQQERQTLASLSHPNIARLYDGGTLDGNAPYIVMEYIDGLTIIKWADENNASKCERLVIFLSACDAVGYAHQNLIVHRDISPSNILVDRAGQPKLIDFGIAKLSDGDMPADASSYSLQSLSFTPGFAAPERSRTGGTSTLSDIYSLGKILETLIQAPRNADLAAIIAKATRAKPEQRYATVAALRDDIERYTKGLPIEAAENSSIDRFRKFVTRHKIGSAIGAMVAVGFLAAFAVILYQYQRAEAALKEADSRFAEVRELANFQLFDLYDELLEIPGTTKVLSRIADKSRSYLDALGDDRRASPALKRDIALSYKRLSDVLGNPESANLGRREESGEMLQMAYNRLTALHRNNPANTALTRTFAETAYSLSIYKFISEDDNEAGVKYAKQAETLYKLLARSGGNRKSDYLRQLSASLQAAKPLLWMGKGGQGVTAMRALRSDIVAYAEDHPGDPEIKVLNANIHTELADTMSWHYDETGGDYSEPLQLMTKGLQLYLEINAANPGNYEIRRNLAGNYYKRAQIYMSLEDDLKTLRDMRTAENYAVELLKIDNNDRNAARILQIVRGEMVMTLAELGRARESVSLGQKILDEKRKSSKKEPENLGLFRDYTNGLFTYATAMNTLGKSKKACDLYRDALANWNIIDSKGKLTDFDKQSAVNEIQENLAKCD